MGMSLKDHVTKVLARLLRLTKNLREGREQNWTGQRELTGAVDLLNHYGLQDLYSHFCKTSLPVSIADSPYLQQVVGDTEIRKGEGMELGQLVETADQSFSQPVHIQTLDLQLLQWAFTLQENRSIQLPEADRGIATISGNVKEDKDRKHKKKHKKHKHRHKDKEKDKKDKDKDPVKGENGEDRSKKHRSKKKRKHEGAEEEGDDRKHKKKKHKHSAKVDGSGGIKNGK